MLFVALLSTKPACIPEQSLQRRMEWKDPQGLKRIAEYWLQTNAPHVIVVFEADDITPIREATAPWMDIYDITVVPATRSVVSAVWNTGKVNRRVFI